MRKLRIPQYEAKPYPRGREEQIQALFSRSFGGRILSREMIEWQMLQNPCRQGRAVSLWEGENLVGYNALTPVQAAWHGRRILAAGSGTTMVDERYMGASLQLFTECQAQNPDIELIYGFPNRNSFGITTKYLGHRYVGDVAFWTCPAREVEPDEDIREISCFTSAHGALGERLAGAYAYMKLRDEAYLNWRFFRKPEITYRAFELLQDGTPVAYMVTDIYVENGVRQLQLVELLAESEEALSRLLLFGISLAWRAQCREVKLWLTAERFCSVLKDAGFSYGEHPFPMTVWDGELEIPQAYITMSDSDIF